MSPRHSTSGETPGNNGSRERAATCQDRIDRHLEDRIAELRSLLNDDAPEAGDFAKYGLGFDYVPRFTFDEQAEGYFRYQLSWGGPSDEFRFFTNPDFICHRVEYWFLDWFDGASRTLSDSDAELLDDLWDWLSGSGTVEHEYRKAQAP